MKTVFKYQFRLDDTANIDLPVGAKVLHVDYQVDTGHCVWALVDPDAPVRTETLHVRGTGHPVGPEILDSCAHLSTFQAGPFVWHVFGPDYLKAGDLR